MRAVSAKEYWRGVQKDREVIDHAEAQRDAALVQELHRVSRQEGISAALEELDPLHREVIEWWLQDWTLVEIAEILGIPENTARSRKATALRKLQEHFGVLPPSKKKG